MRQLQTRVLLLTSLLAVGGLVLVLVFVNLRKDRPTDPKPPISQISQLSQPEISQETDEEFQLRRNSATLEGSHPLSELPAHIKAPEGRISIHLNPQGDQLQAIVVNRTGKVMETSEHLHQLLLRLEAEFAPGDWKRTERHELSFCGNSYFGGPYLLDGRFRYVPLYFPRAVKEPGATIECQIRLRCYTDKYGEVAVSEPVMWTVRKSAHVGTSFDAIGMGERTTKELWQIARNEPTLEQTQFWDATRFDAVRRLERKGADLDELIRVVETFEPGKQEYSQQQKGNVLRDLRSSKAKPVK